MCTLLLLTSLAIALPVEEAHKDAGSKGESGAVGATKQPVVVVANLTEGLNVTNGKPIELKARVEPVPAKPGELSTPAISLTRLEKPSKPLGLVAKVPPEQPVEIHANIPFDAPVRVVTDVAPGVPEVAVVVDRV